MDYFESLRNTKSVLIVAGANGCGKTTFARGLLRRRRFDLPFLNPDEIAEELGDAAQTAALRAGKLYVTRRNNLLAEDRSFAIETTFCGHNMERFIKSIKAKGYKLFVVYAFVDNPELCIARIKIRVESGGHLVPEHLVRKRFNASHLNFWTKYRLLADEWAIVYNGGRPPVLVATGQGSDYTVKNPALYNLFEGNASE